MIETVLSHAQKLFGRGFLIAAFVPSLIFVAVIVDLLRGFGTVQAMVLGWAQKGWKETLFEMLLVFVSVYLVAYIIYGVRAAIHQFYQGHWSGPLKVLLPLGLARAAQLKRRLEVVQNEKLEMLNVARWAMKKKFAGAFSPSKLEAEKAKLLAQKVHTSHQHLLLRLERNRRWKEKTYWDILAKAHLLRANQPNLPEALQSQIETLINEIKAAYEKYSGLRQATVHLNTAALREWTNAANELAANFPTDERWLRPMRLGNVVNVLESYTLDRYGINLSDLWPRLIQVIAEDARLRIEEASIYLDFTIIMSALSFAAGAAGLSAIFYGPSRPPLLQLLLLFLFLAISWLFYYLAIQAARALGVQMQAAVDLFRLKLLDTLDIERPATPAQEKAIWTEFRYFIAQAHLPEQHIRYKSASKEKPKSEDNRPTLLRRFWAALTKDKG